MNNKISSYFSIYFLAFYLFTINLAHSQNLDPILINYADAIIINANVVSMDDTGVNENVGATYQALAIRDNRILRLGNSDDILKLSGPETVVYDVQGRTVVPGIIDTHAHIWQYAQSHWGPQLGNQFHITAEDGETWQDVIDKTLKLASDVKQQFEPNDWVLINWPRKVAGLDKNVAIRTHQIMTRQMLDQANTSQRIAILGNRGVMNTLAMESYGRYFNGEYPPEIDPETGIVISATVYRHLFAEELYDLNATMAMIEQEIREWTAYGTTSFSSSIESFKQMTAVLALDAEERLATRVAYGLGNTFYLTMKMHPYLGYDFAGYGTDKLWFNAWSTTSNDGAYPLIASTIEAPPEIKERELLRSRVPFTREFAEKGLKFGNTHIAGDRTLDITMDMIESGSAEAGLSLEEIRAKRHGSDHCNLNPRPEQIPRLKKLGMIMSCTPMYIARTNAVEIANEYGEQYLEWLVPMRTILEGGVMAVYESDSHQIAGTGHFYFLSQMVNRINIEGEVIAPNQRINRIWALKTATTWAPYYLHKEDEIGTLEEGKFADLQVLNKNYFDETAVPDMKLKTVRPYMTLVGGELMYLDPHLASELGIDAVGIQPEQVIRQIAEWEEE